MDDLEQQLQRARLATPSADLDRRIEATFAAARRREHRSFAPSLWHALAVLATAGSATLLFLSIRSTPPVSTPTVYTVEAEGQMRAMLTNESGSRSAPPFVFHVTPPEMNGTPTNPDHE